MHYKNGREAKVGDTVLCRLYNGKPFTGVIVGITPGCTTCNADVVPLPAETRVVTIGEVLHVDDAIKAD